jgi:uncharacterized protein (DUF58 family)
VTTSVDGARSRTVVLRGGAGRSSITVSPAARGLATLARPDALALGIDGLVAGWPVKGPDQRCVVLPVPDRMPRATVSPLRSRAIGAHSTHRAGEGTDLLEIRPFQPGDRTRRIDWRTSARRQQFYVRAHTVDSAASLVLCLDSRLDVDQSVANWAHPRCPGIPTSSLDLAVRALTSLAWAHVQQGDRVALIDLGSRSGWVPAGSGRRHYLDLRLRLALASPPQRGTGPIVAPARFDAKTVVVVASPFLDAAPASITYQAAAQSSRTIAIDVLPDPLTPDRHTPGALDALDVVLAERRDRLASLERAGVLVTRWDPGAVPTWLRPRSQT